jgi:hypothetical protein
MNDPHVETLYYKIKHADHVDYSKAAPLELEESTFIVRVTDGGAQVSMTSHFASVEKARRAVDPYLRAWELDMALRYGPRSLEFVFVRPVIVERKPTPGVTVMYAEAACFAVAGCDARMCVGFANIPQPAAGMKRDPIVDLMYDRYALYREGRTLLGDAANFCFTAIKMGGGGERSVAASHFAVSEEVLRILGNLTANKGGMHARKATGAGAEYSLAERQWLEDAMKRLIRRAAEVAFDSEAVHPQITMADLPSLAGKKRVTGA